EEITERRFDACASKDVAADRAVAENRGLDAATRVRLRPEPIVRMIRTLWDANTHHAERADAAQRPAPCIPRRSRYLPPRSGCLHRNTSSLVRDVGKIFRIG